MGGVKTQVNGKTSIEGLYAIGEAGCTGLHGANRLASNSILECAVTAFELVNYLKTLNLENNFNADKEISRITEIYENNSYFNDFERIDSMFKELKELMWNNVGIIRNETNLRVAASELEYMSSEFGYTYKCPDRAHYEMRNMLTVAQLIVEFALNRKESRGAHYREDYPQREIHGKSHEKTIQTIMKG